MAGRAAAARGGPGRAGLRLLLALALDVVRVACDQDPLDPLYLPAALELLDAPEHFRVQQVGRYPPANSSLGSRSETFLLLQPWPRAQPLLRASYPPFATQQVVPPRVTEPHQRPVPWDVRAVSVEAAVTPAEPHARVLFHLKGQDWPPGPGGLPCARLHATHPAGTAHRACRFQTSLGACVVELAFPPHWFAQGSSTRAELAYTLEPAAKGPGGCGPGEEDPREQALPVGSVELRPADPPQYQEVPLDEAVTLRVPDVPVRPGQLFSATLLLRHNFTANLLSLRIKVKKGLYVTAARLAQPELWTAKLDRSKGSKHHSALITCHRTGPTGSDPSPLDLSEFLWVDFLVENGTGGGVAVTRPVTWQLEYPGQAPEAEKDKMVWEILVSERDIRALVPLAKAEELVNTAPLTGVPRRVPVRLVTVDSGGALAEVTEHIGCESANTQVLQVSEACDAVFVAGKESRGARGVRVDFWWRRLRASLRLTVWAPLLPLRIELTDTTLEQVRGWRVPGAAEGPAEPEAAAPAEEAERRARGCRLQYQRAGVRFLVPFAAHPLDGGRRLTHLLGPDWLLDVTHLVAPHARVQDPRVASLEGGRVLVGREPGVTSIEVRSPLSDSILGEQALAVTDDKVSVLELRVQPVMGISLALSRGTAHPGEVTATCWAQSALPAPKQEVALSLWLSFSDHTLAPAELYDHRDLGLSVSAEEPGAILPAEERGAQLGVVVSGAGPEGLPLHVALHPPEPCRRGRHRVPLASGTAWLGLPPLPTPAPALPSSPAGRSPATEASKGGERQAAGSVGGSEGVRGKFEPAEEKAGETEAREEEEEEEEEEMVPAPQRVTDLELGMYALLGIFCLAILIFLVNGVVFVLRYQRKEPPDSAPNPASPQPHNWVWLGTDQEELSRQLDRQSPGPPKGEGSCPCESGGGGEPLAQAPAPAPAPAGGTTSSSSTLARKEAGGRRKRVEFVTFAPAPPAQLPEEPVGAPAVQSILVAGEEDIRWVCEDMGLKDPEELRSYMERIRGSS
ncbi:transmembrane protein 132A [Talpa occidentalis]|uniref:transmembrane protein 132A n=1 Tax=Talpa occidentalis TaxID=50954 RepID=UPI001890616E|nr:transmembrane protein 132A [Talpa occidentalis]